MFYKTDTDWPALQAMVEHVMYNNEFFIQKAIGWSLRQYSKTDPHAVQTYIESMPFSGLVEREGMKWINRNLK